VFAQWLGIERRKLAMPVHNLWVGTRMRSHDAFYLPVTGC
jgi:hypothetical protein